MEAAKEGYAAEDVRIPQRKVACSQFVEAELAPVDELQGEVPVSVRKDQFTTEEGRAKRDDGQRQQKHRGQRIDTGVVFP